MQKWKWAGNTWPPHAGLPDAVYTNWHQGEPNNHGNINENAAIMNYPAQSNTGDWYDAPDGWVAVAKPYALCGSGGNSPPPPPPPVCVLAACGEWSK